MAKVKKAQKGMTMKQLKMKYPKADTTARGDVRGSEMNSGAPKKVLKQYNDTYNAFERKFGNKPAKDKKGGVVKKAQAGLTVKSTKRVGPVDPKGAWTKVQEMTIAGKKTPVSLKKDKEQGATKMAKTGAKVDKKWIQKAVNPKHKGFCTPMTKKTCTPKRKALAMTFKKMAKARKGK
jgi:hypothetical protein